MYLDLMRAHLTPHSGTIFAELGTLFSGNATDNFLTKGDL